MRVLLLLCFALTVGFAVVMAANRPKPFTSVDWIWTAVTLVLVAALYFGSGTRRYELVSTLFVGAAIGIPCLASWMATDPIIATGQLSFIVLGIMFSAFLLSPRRALVTTGIGLMLATATSLFHPLVPASVAYDKIGLFVFVSVLTIATAHFHARWKARVEESGRELRRTEQRNQLVLDSALDAVVTLDSTGRITAWNPRATLIFGYERMEALGKRILHLLQLDLPEKMRSCLFVDECEGLDRPVEVTALHRDGREIPVELALSAIRDDQTKIYGVFIRDLTDKKKLEAHLRLTDRLASAGTLVAGVAHEINNPLAYLSTNLELLEQGGRSDKQLRALDAAQEAAQRIRAIVSDLQTFATNKNDHRVTNVDVAQVLQSTMRMAGNEMRHRARTEERIEPVPLVRADPARLGQLFLNLLINAAQSIEDDAVETNLIGVALFEREGRVIIEIADTGCGIAPEIRDQIFDPFLTTKASSGSGLGLYICHQIVSSLEGTIEFSANGTRGTRVEVALPAVAGSTSLRRSVRKTADPIIQTTAGARVLIVDDEDALLTAIAESLHPYELTTAGPAEVKELPIERYEVIVCDLMMPELSGRELHQWIREVAPGHESRIVFMTGGAFSGWAQRFLREIDNRCVQKPFGTNELIAAIEETLMSVRLDSEISEEVPTLSSLEEAAAAEQ